MNFCERSEDELVGAGSGSDRLMCHGPGGFPGSPLLYVTSLFAEEHHVGLDDVVLRQDDVQRRVGHQPADGALVSERSRLFLR